MSFSVQEKRRRAVEILAILKERYPDARVLLDYKNPFELLAATILAAQCTDERVNEVTPSLFRHFSDPKRMSEASLGELEELIRPTGFYKNKAKALKAASGAIEKGFAGRVPESIDELVTLPGVGRKTANVIVGNCFEKPAIIVDTHMKRVATRLGLTENRNPDKIEMELRGLLPEGEQTAFSKVVSFHGRYTCAAKRPRCGECVIERLCSYKEKNI